MKPEYDGILLIALLVLAGVAKALNLIDAPTFQRWADLLIGAFLVWIRTAHTQVAAVTKKGNVNVEAMEEPK